MARLESTRDGTLQDDDLTGANPVIVPGFEKVDKILIAVQVIAKILIDVSISDATSLRNLFFRRLRRNRQLLLPSSDFADFDFKLSAKNYREAEFSSSEGFDPIRFSRELTVSTDEFSRSDC